MKNNIETLNLLDHVIGYMEEHGKMNDFKEWLEMYDEDADQILLDIENRWNNG